MTLTAIPRADDRADFESLVSDVLPVAYRVALHLARDPVDAEDLVQDAAVDALRGFGTFTPGTNFKAWFLRVLTNAFLMRCRKEKRRANDVPLDEAPDLYLFSRSVESGFHASEPDPARALMSRLDTEAITAAIHSLPPSFRTVAALYFIEDLTYGEIASILGLPVGTVRSRLHRGRAALQRALWAAAVEHGIVPVAPA